MGVATAATGGAGLGGNSLARVPKNRRSKRAAEKRAPKLEENPKSTLLIRGLSTSGVITELLRDLYIVKKPFAKHFSRKNEIRPFEDPSSLEFFSLKNDAALFAFGSHSKKRPHNLVLGRMFDHQMLDMCELAITNFQGLAAFAKTARPKEISSRPLMLFDGDGFEHNENLSKLRNLLLDFFRGAPADKVNLRGIDHAIVCTAVGGEVVTLRTYSIGLKKAADGDDSRMARCVLRPMGPCFDMEVRRTQWAASELAKQALRRPKSAHYKPRAIKNVQKDGIGDQYGRLHIDKQDFSKLALRRFKTFKGGGDSGEQMHGMSGASEAAANARA